jgi:hypothetical protein
MVEMTTVMIEITRALQSTAVKEVLHDPFSNEAQGIARQEASKLIGERGFLGVSTESSNLCVERVVSAGS